VLVPERDSWVSNTRHDVRILGQTQPTLEVRVSTPREVCVSIKKCETHVQNGMSLRYKEPKSPHPYEFEASSSDVAATDPKYYLIRKRSVHQITLQCHCKRLISAVLSDCHCDFQITKPLIFSRLSAASSSSKRWWSWKKESISNVEYPKVTAKMVGPSPTPSKSKGRQLSQFKGVGRWPVPRFEGYSCRTEGVYWHTRTRTRTIVPVDYSLLAREIEVNDEHSAIVESKS